MADAALLCALLAMCSVMDLNGNLLGLPAIVSETSEGAVLVGGIGVNLWLACYDRRRRVMALALLVLFVGVAAPAFA